MVGARLDQSTVLWTVTPHDKLVNSFFVAFFSQFFIWKNYFANVKSDIGNSICLKASTAVAKLKSFHFDRLQRVLSYNVFINRTREAERKQFLSHYSASLL